MLDYGDGPPKVANRASDARGAGVAALLANAFRVGLRHKKLLLLMAVAGAASGFVLTKALTPKYVATTQIYLDPHTLPGFEKEQSTSLQDSTGFINFVETQARILTSQVVLERAVTAERLASDPEFGGGVSLLSRLLGKSKPAESENEAKAGAIRTLGQRIGIHRAERTFIIDISATSSDPQKSARIANAVAQAYLETRSSMQMESAKQATISFTARLGSLRERLIAAEHAVEDYKAKNGFIGPRDQYLDDQTLQQLNQQLTYARTRLEDAQAHYQQAQRAKRSNEDLAALTETLNLATLTNLRVSYSEARQKLADMSAELGPQHPAIRNATARVVETRHILDAEIDRIAQSFKKDFERARDFEAGLRRKVDESRGKSVDAAQASVKLRELEREVEVNRGIYESFLARSRQTAESQQLDPASTHIVTVAVPPIARSFPPSALLMTGAGSIFGAALGVAFAIWLERRSRGGDSFAGHGSNTAASDAEFAVTDATRLVLREVANRRHGALELTRLGVPVAGPYGDRREINAIARRLVELSSNAEPLKVVAVVGEKDDHVRTIMSVNLALALKWDGLKVALLDADEENAALTAFVEDESVSSRRAPKSYVDTREEALLVLPAIDKETSAAEALETLLRGTEGPFDVVLCDGAVNDPRMQEKIDMVIVVLGVTEGKQEALSQLPASLASKVSMILRFEHSNPWRRKRGEMRKSA